MVNNCEEVLNAVGAAVKDMGIWGAEVRYWLTLGGFAAEGRDCRTGGVNLSMRS